MTKKHPKLPPATVPKKCPHEHLKFEDGTFTVACMDCPQRWDARAEKGGQDYGLKATPMYPPRDTRHDPFVLPRVALPPLPGPGRIVMGPKK